MKRNIATAKQKQKPTNNRAILYKFELNSTKYVQVFFSV